MEIKIKIAVDSYLFHAGKQGNFLWLAVFILDSNSIYY